MSEAPETHRTENQAPDGAVLPPVGMPEPTQVVVRKQPKALAQRDPIKIAQAFFESGYFKDVRTMQQAVVKIVAGEEIGIGPMAAIKGITMIEGQLGYTGNLIATLVKQHPTYEYKVVERTNERCKIEFYVGDELEGISEFEIADAKRAGLVKTSSNWEKWPRAMCFNRALTEGVRAYIPDVTAGTPAYTDDEIEEVIETAPVADEAPTLDIERVQELIDLIEAAEDELAKGGVNAHDGLNVLLGSLGIDGFDVGTTYADELAELAPEQADALNAELQKMADAAAEQPKGGDTNAE